MLYCYIYVCTKSDIELNSVHTSSRPMRSCGNSGVATLCVPPYIMQLLHRAYMEKGLPRRLHCSNHIAHTHAWHRRATILSCHRHTEAIYSERIAQQPTIFNDIPIELNKHSMDVFACIARVCAIIAAKS